MTYHPSFEVFFQHVIAVEGGYVNDPKDSGGETNYGITVEVARKHGYGGPMSDMPISFAKLIYFESYWRKLLLDHVANIHEDVAKKLADIAVNMGQLRAGEFFQRMLNVLNQEGQLYPDLRVDGKVGPRTVAAFKAFITARGPNGGTVMLRGLNCLQGSFYVSLAERRQKDERFIFGWLLNRIN